MQGEIAIDKSTCKEAELNKIQLCCPVTAFGSTASRRASPAKLIATTRITISSPGGIHSQGWEVRTVRDWALFSIFPRLAAGGCTPIPRKLKDASSSMDRAITEVAYTNMGATVLGR